MLSMSVLFYIKKSLFIESGKLPCWIKLSTSLRCKQVKIFAFKVEIGERLRSRYTPLKYLNEKFSCEGKLRATTIIITAILGITAISQHCRAVNRDANPLGKCIGIKNYGRVLRLEMSYKKIWRLITKQNQNHQLTLIYYSIRYFGFLREMIIINTLGIHNKYSAFFIFPLAYTSSTSW